MAKRVDYSRGERKRQFIFDNVYLQNWYNAVMKPTTRLRILDYLRKQQTASALDLSRALGMTRANIRHHLVVLESNELVEVIGQRREGKGRPENIYGMSRRMLGDGLVELSSALLNEWFASLPEGEREAGLRSIAGRLGRGFGGAGTGPLPKRLTEMVRFLNELHYQARWEAGAAGARLVLGHCPFTAIIAKHPELCQMDAFLLGGCLRQGVEQVAKLERPGQGLPQCVFLVT
jgi:predicted ArsR family transcriptional regulator